MRSLPEIIILVVQFTTFLSVQFANGNESDSNNGHVQGEMDFLSEWTQWSSCTRTCGTGIQFRGRRCHRNRRACKIPRQYRTCNNELCPVDARDFRDFQCSQEDSRNVMMKGKKAKFKSIFRGMYKCALFCHPIGFRMSMFFGQVKDGTMCAKKPYSVCVAGECKEVGCDRVIGTKRTLDKCQICGGNGSTCEPFSGMVERKPNHEEIKEGFAQLYVLPVHATTILISEPSTNYIAIKRANGEYVFNGGKKISSPGKYRVAKTDFKYSRLPDDLSEAVMIMGPTTEEYYVMGRLMSNGSVKSDYEYWLPKKLPTTQPIQILTTKQPTTTSTPTTKPTTITTTTSKSTSITQISTATTQPSTVSTTTTQPTTQTSTTSQASTRSTTVTQPTTTQHPPTTKRISHDNVVDFNFGGTVATTTSQPTGAPITREKETTKADDVFFGSQETTPSSLSTRKSSSQGFSTSVGITTKTIGGAISYTATTPTSSTIPFSSNEKPILNEHDNVTNSTGDVKATTESLGRNISSTPSSFNGKSIVNGHDKINHTSKANENITLTPTTPSKQTFTTSGYQSKSSENPKYNTIETLQPDTIDGPVTTQRTVRDENKNLPVFNSTANRMEPTTTSYVRTSTLKHDFLKGFKEAVVTVTRPTEEVPTTSEHESENATIQFTAGASNVTLLRKIVKNSTLQETTPDSLNGTLKNTEHQNATVIPKIKENTNASSQPSMLNQSTTPKPSTAGMVNETVQHTVQNINITVQPTIAHRLNSTRKSTEGDIINATLMIQNGRESFNATTQPLTTKHSTLENNVANNQNTEAVFRSDSNKWNATRNDDVFNTTMHLQTTSVTSIEKGRVNKTRNLAKTQPLTTETPTMETTSADDKNATSISFKGGVDSNTTAKRTMYPTTALKEMTTLVSTLNETKNSNETTQPKTTGYINVNSTTESPTTAHLKMSENPITTTQPTIHQNETDKGNAWKLNVTKESWNKTINPMTTQKSKLNMTILEQTKLVNNSAKPLNKTEAPITKNKVIPTIAMDKVTRSLNLNSTVQPVARERWNLTKSTKAPNHNSTDNATVTQNRNATVSKKTYNATEQVITMENVTTTKYRNMTVTQNAENNQSQSSYFPTKEIIENVTVETNTTLESAVKTTTERVLSTTTQHKETPTATTTVKHSAGAKESNETYPLNKITQTNVTIDSNTTKARNIIKTTTTTKHKETPTATTTVKHSAGAKESNETYSLNKTTQTNVTIDSNTTKARNIVKPTTVRVWNNKKTTQISPLETPAATTTAKPSGAKQYNETYLLNATTEINAAIESTSTTVSNTVKPTQSSSYLEPSTTTTITQYLEAEKSNKTTLVSNTTTSTMNYTTAENTNKTETVKSTKTIETPTVEDKKPKPSKITEQHNYTTHPTASMSVRTTIKPTEVMNKTTTLETIEMGNASEITTANINMTIYPATETLLNTTIRPTPMMNANGTMEHSFTIKGINTTATPIYKKTVTTTTQSFLIEPSTNITNTIGTNPWGPWTPCSRTCGMGFKVRARPCNRSIDGPECLEKSTQISLCIMQPCGRKPPSWSPWRTWTACSSSCGVGVKVRIRSCRHSDVLSTKSSECVGRRFEVDLCRNRTCGKQEYTPKASVSSVGPKVSPSLALQKGSVSSIGDIPSTAVYQLPNISNLVKPTKSVTRMSSDVNPCNGRDCSAIEVVEIVSSSTATPSLSTVQTSVKGSVSQKTKLPAHQSISVTFKPSTSAESNMVSFITSPSISSRVTNDVIKMSSIPVLQEVSKSLSTLVSSSATIETQGVLSPSPHSIMLSSSSMPNYQTTTLSSAKETNRVSKYVEVQSASSSQIQNGSSLAVYSSSMLTSHLPSPTLLLTSISSVKSSSSAKHQSLASSLSSSPSSPALEKRSTFSTAIVKKLASSTPVHVMASQYLTPSVSALKPSRSASPVLKSSRSVSGDKSSKPCPPCIMSGTKNILCKSDYAIHAVVSKIYINSNNKPMYSMNIIKTYKSTRQLPKQLALRVLGKHCPCPNMQIGKEYVIFGKLKMKKAGHLRVMFNRRSFVHEWSQEFEKEVDSLQRSCDLNSTVITTINTVGTTYTKSPTTTAETSTRPLSTARTTTVQPSTDPCPLCRLSDSLETIYCKNDYAIRAKVTKYRQATNRTMYYAHVITTYKARQELPYEVLIRVPGQRCPCPPLKVGVEYIMVGTSKATYTGKQRLTLSINSFVKKWNDDLDETIGTVKAKCGLRVDVERPVVTNAPFTEGSTTPQTTNVPTTSPVESTSTSTVESMVSTTIPQNVLCTACSTQKRSETRQTRYCNSEEVFRGRVVKSYQKSANRTQYLIIMVKTIKSTFELPDKISLRVANNACLCGRLSVGNDFLMMGRVKDKGKGRSRMTLTRKSYIQKWDDGLYAIIDHMKTQCTNPLVEVKIKETTVTGVTPAVITPITEKTWTTETGKTGMKEAVIPTITAATTTKGSACPHCRVSYNIQDYCSNEYVLRVRVLKKYYTSANRTVYHVSVNQTYKSTEATEPVILLRVPGIECHCPKLRIGVDYVVMGLVKRRKKGPSTMKLSSGNFVQLWNEGFEEELESLRLGCTSSGAGSYVHLISGLKPTEAAKSTSSEKEKTTVAMSTVDTTAVTMPTRVITPPSTSHSTKTCSPCQIAKGRKKLYCISDFVLAVQIQERVHNTSTHISQYYATIEYTYKAYSPLDVLVAIIVPNDQCNCPHLEINESYVLMANIEQVNGGKTRLVLPERPFVKIWSKSFHKKMMKLKGYCSTGHKRL